MSVRRTLSARVLGLVAAVALAGATLTAQAGAAAASPGVTHCPAAALKITEHDGGAGLSHAGVRLEFTNISTVTCTLTGYPKVGLLNGAGTVVLHATPTRSGYLGGLPGGHPIPVVTLAPKKSASALLEGIVVRTNGDACPVEHAIRVTSPQTFRLVRLSGSVGLCTDVQVHPVMSGTQA